VADVARLARGEGRADAPTYNFETPFDYRHTLGGYLAR
jgi:hypothetical protein